MNATLLKRSLVLLLPYMVLLIVTQSNGLFYDTTQFAGDVPNWYYFNNFSTIVLPDLFDSGHPPGFGLYLAALWKLFGRTLEVSHWAMLPFLFLNAYQTVRFAHILFPNANRKAWGLSILLLTQTTLLAQSTLVSPDVIVYGAGLWMLNSVFRKDNTGLSLAVILVACISTRGMSIAFILFFVKWLYDFRTANTTVLTTGFKALLPFLAGGLVGAGYMLFHYQLKGWVVPTAGTPWGYAFEKVSGMELLKHQVVLLVRIVDLGNVLSVLLALALMVLYRFRTTQFDFASEAKQRLHMLMVLSLLLFVCTVFPLTLYKGLLSQRYLLFFTTVVIATGYSLLMHYKIQVKTQAILLMSMIVVQLSGSFWVYPKNLSLSWDCMLTHLPYYELRQDFIQYFEEHDIDRTAVVTEFPMHKSGQTIDYSADTLRYQVLNEVPLDSVEYLWYSNVCNALLKQKPYFEEHFTQLKYIKNGRVEMILYRRKK